MVTPRSLLAGARAAGPPLREDGSEPWAWISTQDGATPPRPLRPPKRSEAHPTDELLGWFPGLGPVSWEPWRAGGLRFSDAMEGSYAGLRPEPLQT